jgi:dTDP-4-dehydrorhamnose reductase
MDRPLLILGATGMLGHKLWQVLAPRFDTHVTARAPFEAVRDLGLFDPSRWHGGIDLLRLEDLEQILEQVRPGVVINAVGAIKQRASGQNPIEAIQLNSLLPHRLHVLTRSLGAHLIHISTDCVFSGERGGYREDDHPDPVDIYGRSKLLGEVDAPGSLTMRTSIIGRELAGEYGLVEWFLAQDGGRVRGFANAIYTGMPTVVLASLLGDLLERPTLLSGLYQVSSTPISKYDLLLLLREAYGLSIQVDRDETFRCDRSLIGQRFTAETGLQPPSWPEMVERMAADSATYVRWRAAAIA